MQINEIFSSIDGEGIRTGYLVTFIRSQLCNCKCSYCFGVKPGRNTPKVSSVWSIVDERYTPSGARIKGTQIPLNCVKVGDELFTLDDNLNIVTTKVTNVLDREVTEWLEIKIDDTIYYVTPEHPIFTTRGMVTASELVIGDIILHSTYKDMASIRMSLNEKVSISAVANCNGLEVTSIKHIDITKHKHFGRDYGPKPLHVYNLTCAPYNTYLLDTMWVHNCDTLYSLEPCDKNGNKQYKDMTVAEILEECKKLGNKRITFTGGEPLIQPDAAQLVHELVKNGYEVNIETNGAVDLQKFSMQLSELDTHQCYENLLFYTMDYKCPTSGMMNKMIDTNLEYLCEDDVLKFVVGSKEDLDTMKDIITKYNVVAEIFVSPVFGKIEMEDIVNYIKDNNLQNVRMQVQLHKIIWDVNKRGV